MHAGNETHISDHIEREESSSSGWETQRLPSHQVPAWSNAMPLTNDSAAPQAWRGRQSNNILGVILIGLGVLLWSGQMIPGSGEITGGLVLLTIASCFLFFAFWQRIYGLLIPGSILAGLSIGVSLATLTNGVSVLWGLALGFLSILVVGRALFNVQSPWPAIPAVILFGVGVIVAFASLPTFFGLSLVWLPLLLIGAGLFLGWGRRAA